ncbi:hypothetical protein P9112_000134 [Eukaryota sp. TZLM1-RC]
MLRTKRRPRTTTPRRRFRPVGQSDVENSDNSDHEQHQTPFRHRIKSISSYGPLSPDSTVSNPNNSTSTLSFTRFSSAIESLDSPASKPPSPPQIQEAKHVEARQSLKPPLHPSPCPKCQQLQQTHDVVTSLAKNEITSLKSQNVALSSISKQCLSLVKKVMTDRDGIEARLPTDEESRSELVESLDSLRKSIKEESLSQSLLEVQNIQITSMESEIKRLRTILAELVGS